MKHPVKILCFLLTAALLESGALDTDTEKFFSGPRASEIKLPDSQVYPRGRLFPFSFYSVGGGAESKRGELLPDAVRLADQEKILKSGATLVGPQYELNETSRKEAAKYGFRLIYSICPEINGKAVTRDFFRELEKTRRKFDEKAISRSIAEQVRRAAQCREIAWWDITPEEMRFWMPEERRYLEVARKAILENDPWKRPVFMYEPGHRNASSLAKLLPYQDLSVKGTYVNYSGMKNQRAWARYSMRQQVEAIRLAGLSRIVPIALPEMFQQPRPEELAQVRNWVRHDVYAMLASGAKGVLVFSASRRPDFSARETYLNAYLEVCRELTGPLKLGEVFLFGAPRSDLEYSVLEGPEEITFSYQRKKHTCSSVATANLAYDGARYVVLVNSAGKAVKMIVSGLVYGSGVTVKSLLDSTEEFIAPEGDFEVELKPLEAAVFKVFNKS